MCEGCCLLLCVADGKLNTEPEHGDTVTESWAAEPASPVNMQSAAAADKSLHKVVSPPQRNVYISGI